MDWLDDVKWGPDGLVPAIAQEQSSGDILMVAWMNREALAATVRTGQAVYWSRSRQRLWHKGEESGHFQQVQALHLDCDGDVVLLTVVQLGHDPGIACHTGRHSCFFRRLQDGQWQIIAPVLKEPAPAGAHAPATVPPAPRGDDTLQRLAEVIASRHPDAGGDPAKSYVARLFSKGTDAMLKKVGEEATEFVMAAKDGAPERIVAEAADLWFHSLVALAHFGLGPADVLAELRRREGLSGLEEFALRKAQQREGDGT